MSKELICNRHEKVIKILETIRETIQTTLRYDNGNAEALEELLNNIDNDLLTVDTFENAAFMK